ncbi:KAP family P-loop NTPase fold protein [Rhodococcus sovatensis]|uniref:P-loop NTPase fold protein n=1 Tax=Rhodococcus sovatensis TaxID=1805840 RepID=A0ABZ2PNR3_9NOCA
MPAHDAADTTDGAGEIRTHHDVEIKSMGDDRLDRRQFARRVAERIHRAGQGPSVVFGLAGPWGSGKTSVLNMITDVITTEHRDAWSVVSFTPWSTDNTPTLTEEFYRAIAYAMPPDERGEKAKRLLNTAAPVAGAVMKAVATAALEKYVGKGAVQDAMKAGSDAFADQAADFTADIEPDPFVKRFSDISAAIDTAGRNILVIVDDVDRLHADELLSVMKSVRLLGRFDRVHYLLSYDEDTVIDVLRRSDLALDDSVRARRYLEKIVQYPFALPPIQQLHLAREFRDQLTAIAMVHSAEPTDKAHNETADSLFALLPTDRLTLRSIFRLCTQVDIMLTLTGGDREVDLFDATLITFIRLHYPRLYAEIPRWRAELLRSHPERGTDQQLTPEDKEREVSEFTDSTDPFDARIAYRLLVNLFPHTLPRPKGFYTSRRASPCEIRERDHFDRYFAFGIPAKDVRNADVRTDFTQLISTGTWSSASVIRQCLSEQERRDLVCGKILQHLDVLVDSPPAPLAEAAHLLTRELPLDTRDLLFSRWSGVLYALLAHAITRSTAQEAKSVVNRYRSEFGLPTTVDVLTRPIELDTIDTTTVTAASEDIREEVLGRCVQDLTTELPAANYRTHSVLSFLHYFDDDLWRQLSEQAQELLASDADVTLATLGARFVTMTGTENTQGKFETWASEFRSEDFRNMIPQHLWDLRKIPEIPSEDLNDNDTSLSNRITYAAIALRQILANTEN